MIGQKIADSDNADAFAFAAKPLGTLLLRELGMFDSIDKDEDRFGVRREICRHRFRLFSAPSSLTAVGMVLIGVIHKPLFNLLSAQPLNVS